MVDGIVLFVDILYCIYPHGAIIVCGEEWFDAEILGERDKDKGGRDKVEREEKGGIFYHLTIYVYCIYITR